MIGKNGNFLTAHYDWIVAAVALAALAAGGVMFVGSLGTDAAALAESEKTAIRNTKPGGEPVQAADLTAFVRTSKIAKNPTSLSEVADDKGSFLASERRIFCENEKCQMAIPADVKVCPFCRHERKEEEKVVLDADGDGLPDVWEKKYGLNPNDPADAALDKDSDDFTNLEEFEAKTDPTDRHSHPDYLDSMQISLPLKATVLPFYFTGTDKTPSGLKFSFKDPSRAKEYDRGNYRVLVGEEIGKSGYSPKELVKKTAEETMGGGMKKKVDASEAVVVRKSDGKTVAMRIGRKQVPVDVQAKLVYTRGGQKTFDVVVGDTIELNGMKYVVKEVKRLEKEKGAAVTLEDVKLGKVRTLSAP